MIRKNQRLLNRLNALSDGVLCLLSYPMASWLWLDVISKTSGNIADLENLRGPVMLVALIYAAWTVLLLSMMSVYRTSRVQSRSRRYGRLLVGNTIALATAAAALYLLRLEDFSRGVLGLYYLFSSSAMIGKRAVMYTALRMLRAKGYNQKHILVVGSGKLARQYMESVAADASLGLHVVGQLVPDGKLLDKLEEKLYGTGVDEVILALDIAELGVTADVIYVCEKCGTKISIVPFYNDVIPTNPTIDRVGSVKLIRLRTTPLDAPLGAFAKRSFDVLASAVLLLVLSPLMAVIAIAIKVSSPGPVLFKQTRIGLNKNEFTMLKFRSMRENSRQDTAWSTNVDDRRTRIGSLLRKTSLDELPQLWNVLRGDMSLVGPRPELPCFVEQFRETVPLYMVKYQVRPGITGWAQIHGLRGDTSIPDRVKHDLWYIENWTFGLDIMIIFRTVFGGMVNQEQM